MPGAVLLTWSFSETLFCQEYELRIWVFVAKIPTIHESRLMSLVWLRIEEMCWLYLLEWSQISLFYGILASTSNAGLEWTSATMKRRAEPTFITAIPPNCFTGKFKMNNDSFVENFFKSTEQAQKCDLLIKWK